MGAYRSRTELYYIWRLCERFPNWLKTPDDWFDLDPDTQVLLQTYEAIRETEETLMARMPIHV